VGIIYSRSSGSISYTV